MVDVVVGQGPIVVRRRERVPRVQLGVAIPAELARQLKLFAIEHELLIQDVVEGCIRAVVHGDRSGRRRAA